MLIVTGCDQASFVTPQPRTVTIAGSTAMQPVLAALTDSFVREHPNVLFDIRGGGSRLGEERLSLGEIDMAASTFLPDETSVAADGDVAFMHTPIGLDGLAIIVNRHNPVETLTVLQLRDLFGGRLLSWTDVSPKEIGSSSNGGEQEVLLVSREDGSGSRTLFEEFIMGDDAVALTAVVMPSSADVMAYVGTHPNAVGYVSRAYLTDQAVDETADVHVVSVENVNPMAMDFTDQGYLLTQPLFLVTAGEPSGWTRTFIDFVLSPTGQEVVGRYHARVR